MSLVTSDWTPISKNVFYRKIELYTMGWNDVVLSENTVATSTFGGPIAICKNEKRLQKVYTQHTKPIISIFSSSGEIISQIKWDSGKLIHFAWSATEDLLCINEFGDIHSYDIYGTHLTMNSTGTEAREYKILECKVFCSPGKNHTGVAVLTGAYHIFYIRNIKHPRVRQMANAPGLVAPPSCWTVITNERATKVILSKDSQVFVLDYGKDKCINAPIVFNTPITAITEIAISSNHENVALYADNGCLWFGSATLETKHLELDTKRRTRPHQLMWCGNSAVVGVWPDVEYSWSVFVFSLSGRHLNYSYCSQIHLVPEIDCVRIISDTTHELLQKVPDEVVDVFRIGSVTPGALLLEASKEFQNRNHKAEDYMRLIREKGGLESAIEKCIVAAGHEFSPKTQKMLLRAASYGKAYIRNFDSSYYVKMCKILRILNAVRQSNIGIPISYTQYTFLTLNIVLNRLVFRQLYPVAISICQYMGVPDVDGKSHILSTWACHKVKKAVNDPELCAQIIADKLRYAKRISFSAISNVAMECGQKQLSIKLLDYETIPCQQVPLLIKLGEDKEAMRKAIESGDTDLMYKVIFHMKEALEQKKGSFHREIVHFPEAYALYLKFCKYENWEDFKRSYYEDSNYSGEAYCYVFECNKIDRHDRGSRLAAAAESYKKVKNDFMVQACEDEVKLVKYQTRLLEKHPAPQFGFSVQGTLCNILTAREYDKADAFKKEFKIPDKRFWWAKMTIIAEKGEWLELEKFSKSKKPPPIGFEPFVDICMKHGNSFEAKRYLPKVKDENKARYCMKVGMLDDAAKVAFEQKDIATLHEIQGLCGAMDRTLAEKIMTMKSQLSKR